MAAMLKLLLLSSAFLILYAVDFFLQLIESLLVECDDLFLTHELSIGFLETTGQLLLSFAGLSADL